MTIEELKSIIKIVSRNKVKQIEIVGDNLNDESQVHSLYKLISEGKINQEEVGESLFFGGGPNSTN